MQLRRRNHAAEGGPRHDWLAAADLVRRHPSIDLDANVLCVDNGRVLTSAGAAAGFDLCIHMIRRDLGANRAAAVARLAVMPLERAGGQAQFIEHAPPAEAPGAMTPLLTWMEQNLSRDLPLPVIARRAAMSTRTLSRPFREQVGTTPAAWLAHARVRRAQRLLETTDLQPCEPLRHDPECTVESRLVTCRLPDDAAAARVRTHLSVPFDA